MSEAQPFRLVQTPTLEIAYEESGPEDGTPILLLHGWPDDIRTWDTIAASLNQAGFRTFAPYLRGFGPTRFLSPLTRRSGQVAALAQDAIDFADALGLERFALVGHDWGARAAYLIAANWPDRITQLITLSIPYGGGPNNMPPTPQKHAFWYQWFFQMEQARFALEEDKRSLCRYLWKTWMASPDIDEAAFEETCTSWDNPDWIEVSLHFYRHRWANALPDPRYDALEAVQLQTLKISVPAVLLHGEDDGVSLIKSSEGREHLFTGGYRREVLPDAGHFPQRETPEAVTRAILATLKST